MKIDVAPASDDRLDLRSEFPVLSQRVHDHRLVYLDNAATTQKPTSVLQAIRRFYEEDCSNVHRGVHELSVRATRSYEDARSSVRRLIGAKEDREIVFTSGATGAINLVAHSFGDRFVAAGDEIVVTEMEHHSNIVPWQLLCERVGSKLRVVPMDDRGVLDLDAYEALLGPKTRLVCLTHTSNALGTRNAVDRMAAMARECGARVLIDGAQAMAHERVDVAAMGCDFFAFSGHKMYGPTGIGVLYGKAELLDQMPPFLSGGEMIETVSFSGTRFREIPYRFEAGTPNIAGAIGLGAAVEFLEAAGLDRIGRHEQQLLEYGTRLLSSIPRVRLIGTSPNKCGILSFVVDGIHAHDIGTILDRQGVAVRAGHHCAQPVMQHFAVPATVRASLACYNVAEDLDSLIAGVHRSIELLG